VLRRSWWLGPPGSGKTSSFPVTAFGVDAFNIDDRCAQTLGSYRAIPRHVRRAVAKECGPFVLSHIEVRNSLVVETTLRTKAAIERAQLARGRGSAGSAQECAPAPSRHQELGPGLNWRRTKTRPGAAIPVAVRARRR
jgi:hypothetical protein